MTAALITPPASEPVSLAEAKAHLRIDASDEDDLIASLIAAARRHVELETRRVLITQGWRVYFDGWASTAQLALPLAPLVSVDAVTIYDRDGAPFVLDPSAYQVDTVSSPARLALVAGAAVTQPGQALNGIEIDVTAGYGEAADVPAPLRQAILMLVAHWYEHREAASADAGASVAPLAAMALIANYRTRKL
ncbi:MAG: hypothetical protein C0606_00490 [Hyphomicrobiales bacterium]|nr:MAG: hypothetical protein C0606_00490 [Hyphomicrobiales bacterium]